MDAVVRSAAAAQAQAINHTHQRAQGCCGLTQLLVVFFSLKNHKYKAPRLVKGQREGQAVMVTFR